MEMEIAADDEKWQFFKVSNFFTLPIMCFSSWTAISTTESKWWKKMSGFCKEGSEQFYYIRINKKKAQNVQRLKKKLKLNKVLHFAHYLKLYCFGTFKN